MPFGAAGIPALSKYTKTQKHLFLFLFSLLIMSLANKSNRELIAIRDTANAALRKKQPLKLRAPTGPIVKSVVSSLNARRQAPPNRPPPTAPTAPVFNPHGDRHAAAVFLGAKPANVPSHLAHGIAVHHGIPDEPSGAIRNPRRDHDAADIVSTIEAAFNLIPDTSGALEIDVFPTLFNLMRPTKGSVFVGGTYVTTSGITGYANTVEALKFASLVSGVCCEALEVSLSYVGDINGISGEIAAAAFAAGSSQLMTGVPRPSDLQSMMAYPGAKSCEATQSLHMNLPHSEFTSGPFASASGLNTGTSPYNGTIANWSACEHRPEKMTAPSGSTPFGPAEGSSFSLAGGNNVQRGAPLVPLNDPQYISDYSTVFSVFPPAKFDVLPLLRIVGGNLSTNTQGSWLLKIKACYTGTVISHVGEMYHGASANISNSVTTNAPRVTTFAKTASILNKVGAGVSTSEASTADKNAELATTLASGAMKVGKYLWDTLGGWSGISSKLSTAAAMLAA